MMKKCDKHCWHVRSSTTDGMGEKGFDTVFCCFCGIVRRRKWEYVRDKNHGTYADLLIRREGKIEPRTEGTDRP